MYKIVIIRSTDPDKFEAKVGRKLESLHNDSYVRAVLPAQFSTTGISFDGYIKAEYTAMIQYETTHL